MYLSQYVYNLLLLFDESKMEKTHTCLYTTFDSSYVNKRGGKKNICGGKR